MVKSILDYFPEGKTPSKLQKDVLLELEARWNNSSAFILNLDTASGKSYIAMTIAKWVNSTRVCTPNNVLVNQYQKEFPEVPVSKSRGNYTCGKMKMRCSSMPRRCTGCAYDKSKAVASEAKVSVSTYHMGKALRGVRKLAVFDEAHKLPEITRSMHSSQIMPHTLGLPLDCIGDFSKTLEWLSSRSLDHLPPSLKETVATFKADLSGSSRPLNFYTWGTALWRAGGVFWGETAYRGEPYEIPSIEVTPADIDDKKPPFWREKQKLVLLSATIGRSDLLDLGLCSARPIFIEGDSQIPASNRPIIKDYVGKITKENEDNLLQDIADKLLHYIDTKEGKGLIHITYGLAAKLKPLLKHERLLTHTVLDTKAKLGEFLASKDKVFMVSGMYEGVSLDYDKARWQIIAKIGWPSLIDPFQKYRAENDADYYNWSTLKNVIQAAGRVCRRPDDYGETIIIDGTFERLLSESPHLVPNIFKERIIQEGAS